MEKTFMTLQVYMEAEIERLSSSSSLAALPPTRTRMILHSSLQKCKRTLAKYVALILANDPDLPLEYAIRDAIAIYRLRATKR